MEGPVAVLEVRILGAGPRVGPVRHYEDEDCSGEKVSFNGLVRLAIIDFRCHVSWSSHRCLDKALSLVSGILACESEVDNFEVEVLVEGDVVWLEVSVRVALCLHVLERTQDLPDIVADVSVGEGLDVEVVEQLAVGDVL